MRILKIFIISILITISAPLNANNNAATAGAIVAGVALLATIAADSDSDCKAINYKNYEVNKKMLASPATAIIDDKINACTSKVVLLTGNIKKSESYILENEQGEIVETTNIDNGYRIKIGTTVVTPMEQMSGAEPEDIYVSIDKYGTVIKSNNLFKNLIGKKIFEVTDKIVLKNETISNEIIYTGISGNELHIQYREYQGTTIKWPFTLNLIFDLSKSNLIKIKHYNIEIIEADNKYIVYKVL